MVAHHLNSLTAGIKTPRKSQEHSFAYLTADLHWKMTIKRSTMYYYWRGEKAMQLQEALSPDLGPYFSRATISRNHFHLFLTQLACAGYLLRRIYTCMCALVIFLPIKTKHRPLVACELGECFMRTILGCYSVGLGLIRRNELR